MNATTPLLARTPEEVRSALQSLRAAPDTTCGLTTCGLVPTMGALHSGHAELMQQARAENDLLVVSIFVNPLQFGPNEDYVSYPRQLEADMQLCAQQGVDVVYAPTDAAMYPQGFSTRVSVAGVSDTLDGLSRPGHFTGVATVVLKLLNIIQPTRAYFGEKDWQQVSVLRRMVTDLNVPVELVAVPTVRAQSGPDSINLEAGLALSSRNQYLSAEQRTRATVLSRALRSVQASYQAGERHAAKLLEAGREVLAQESELSLDYLALVDENMQPIETVLPQHLRGGAPRLLIAARLFGVRLIDNMPLVVRGGEQHATQ